MSVIGPKGARVRGSCSGRAASGLRLGCLALGVALGTVGCREEKTAATASPNLLSMDADMALIDMEHFMTRDGLKRAHLRADTAYFLQDSSKVRFRPVDVVFYDGQGREVSHLTAREGLYDMRTNDMEVTGNVVVESRQEVQRLETERLTYRSRDDQLRSDTTFVLYQRTSVIRGSGLISDPSLRRTRVTRPAAVLENARSPGGDGS